MKLPRLAHHPQQLLEFFSDGLTSLGAICEQSWHDRLEVLAEGRPARLWNTDGALHQVELQFTAADVAQARDSASQVFPGCPLTFLLAEALRPAPLPLERFVLPAASAAAPDPSVLEKTWRGQFPQSGRWQLTGPLQSSFHFSLVAVVRCEIQAIDQHWSLHRLAFSWPDGERDEHLAAEIAFQPGGSPETPESWPAVDSAILRTHLLAAVQLELAADLENIRARQERSLGRELARIDEYFAGYQSELTARARRTQTENTRIKMDERLTAARAEHARRRSDQVARHEIIIQIHPEAVLLVAEKAWTARLQVERARQGEHLEAQYVPRLRSWKMRTA